MSVLRELLHEQYACSTYLIRLAGRSWFIHTTPEGTERCGALIRAIHREEAGDDPRLHTCHVWLRSTSIEHSPVDTLVSLEAPNVLAASRLAIAQARLQYGGEWEMLDATIVAS